MSHEYLKRIGLLVDSWVRGDDPEGAPSARRTLMAIGDIVAEWRKADEARGTVLHHNGLSRHMALSIDAAYERWADFISHEGRPVTAYEFEQLRAEYKARGYAVFPPCDNVKPDGRCAGHQPVGASDV